ncbi:protein FAM186B [Acomys russatus]|uniref:protein FAM186B n=1 Tax=Acomys russatus TaxID=60746 RepID=UPI0021E1FB68|nr:protein FAM186B [Acomys russatus]
MEKDNPPHLVTPTSVKAILSKIEAAQLIRTQEDISTQLSDILDNVNCAINRFQKELGYDLKEKAKPHQPEQKGRKRFILLKKIASFSKDAKAKENHLCDILRWLGDWGDSLTYEMKNRRSAEEEEALDEWMEVIEKVLPLSLMATKGGMESLISLCSTLIEEQKKRTQTSKHNFWQDWREKRPQTPPVPPQPLSPEQMLQDKSTTITEVSEVKSMLQELLDSSMFNKGEVKAIRYMSTVVENLSKALILQHKENRRLESKCKHLQVEMTKELSSQRLYFQKSIQVLKSKRDALLKQVEVLGDKYHDLLMIKQALEFQLKTVQSAGGLEEPDQALVGTPPEKETLLEEPRQELTGEGYLFSPFSLSPLAKAWDSGTVPSTHEPLFATATDSRVEDVFSKHLEPVLLHSEVPQFSTQWEKLVEKAPDPEGKVQEDGCFQEKEGVQSKSYAEKSPGSSRRMLVEDHKKHWEEEERSWETRRQQWLQEEEMWLQRQKKWALLEQEHQEKARQWEAEAAARQQWQRFTQPEEKKRSPRRASAEQKEGSEKLIFTPTSRWRNLEKSEAARAPPQCRAQSARQNRRPHLASSEHGQQPGQGDQRPQSSAELMHTPRARQASAKPKKCASFPVSGTLIRRVTRSSLQKVPETPKDKVYHLAMAAQLKNLQILGGLELELALPQCLRSKALEVTAITMELSTLRLQHLCKKYIYYRHFQRIRQEVTKHIGATQQMKVAYKARSLHVFLENIDRLQSVRLRAWTDKQKTLEERHQECLHTMVAMFPKLQQDWNIHLSMPVVTSAKPGKCKSPPVLLQRVRSSSSSNKQPPPRKHQESVALRIARQQGNRMEAIWKADVASSSHPIEKKTPASPPWGQLGGHPDIPRLLALEEHPSHHRSVMPLKARSFSAPVTQRKECQELSEDLSELVRKMSSQSLPGSLQGRKDRAAPVPT